LHSTTTKIFFS